MPEIAACGVCHSSDLNVLLDLGSQPLAERMDAPPRVNKQLPELWYPLKLMQCPNCSLAQLNYIVDQAEVFPRDHPYATGNTFTLREHFAQLAEAMSQHLERDDLIIDIGANDGTLLKAFAGIPVRRIAVEPTAQILKCPVTVTPYRGFFTAELADRIYRKHGPAKLVLATNVLAHVPDVHNFMAGVAALMDTGSLFITENHDFTSITDGLQIDTIYHEHLRYYSLASLSYLFMRHGLAITDYSKIAVHGGSFQVTARKPRADLAQRAAGASRALHVILADAVFTGGKVWGVGATTRATPLIHYFDIASYITAIAEIAGSQKIGTTMPGTAIPVVDEEELIAAQPEYALIFSWHIADDIMPKLRAAGYQGKFIIPLPEPVIADG